jgi:hypothetical protein
MRWQIQSEVNQRTFFDTRQRLTAVEKLRTLTYAQPIDGPENIFVTDNDLSGGPGVFHE